MTKITDELIAKITELNGQGIPIPKICRTLEAENNVKISYAQVRYYCTDKETRAKVQRDLYVKRKSEGKILSMKQLKESNPELYKQRKDYANKYYTDKRNKEKENAIPQEGIA